MKGKKKKAYDSLFQEASDNGTYPEDPAAVLETAMKRIRAEFHESKDSRALKALSYYGDVEKGKGSFLDFSVAWTEALAGLKKVGVAKNETELYYEYVKKLGNHLRRRVSPE
jgi:hypothetical protein